MISASHQRGLLFDGFSRILLLAATAVVFLTFGDHAVNQDELNHVNYGDQILDFYRSGFHYPSILDNTYPGGYDLLTAIARRLLPLDTYDTLHLVGGLVAVLGLVGTWKLGRLLFGPLGGLVSVTLLATCAVYYGNAFNDPKDVPFAAANVWGVYFLCAAVLKFPAVPRLLWFKLGLAIGLSLGVRIGGLLLLCYLVMTIVVFACHRALALQSLEVGVRSVTRLASGFAMTIAAAWPVMMVCWPWTFFAPLQRPLVSLAEMSNYPHDRQILFNGEMIWYSQVPWDYLPSHLGLELPELVVVFGALGVILGTWTILRHSLSSRKLTQHLALGVVGVAVVFPPLYAVAKGSTLYGGLRHMMFVVPIACVVAAGALVALGRVAHSRNRWLGYAIAVAVALESGHQIRAMHELHPHQYAYFNRFIGGLHGAFDVHNTAWGGVIGEGLLALHDHLWRTERGRYLNETYTIKGAFSAFMLSNTLPPNFRRKSRADFIVTSTLRGSHLRREDAPIVLEIKRQSTLLVRVRDLRSRRPSGPWRALYSMAEQGRGGRILGREDSIDLQTGPSRVHPGIPAHGFSVRWDSCLVLDVPMVLLFELSSEQVELSIDGDRATLLSTDGYAGVATPELPLAAGVHHLRAFYSNDGQDHVVRLGAAAMSDAPVLPLSAYLRYPGDELADENPCAGVVPND